MKLNEIFNESSLEPLPRLRVELCQSFQNPLHAWSHHSDFPLHNSCHSSNFYVNSLILYIFIVLLPRYVYVDTIVCNPYFKFCMSFKSLMSLSYISIALPVNELYNPGHLPYGISPDCIIMVQFLLVFLCLLDLEDLIRLRFDFFGHNIGGSFYSET